MKTNTAHKVADTRTVKSTVGNSLYEDDIWDISPLIPIKSLPPSRKKLNFTVIKSPMIKSVAKQYIFYKLGQVKPQSTITIMNSLSAFFRYCDINHINSFLLVDNRTLVDFAFWLKNDVKLSKKTGYLTSFAVEELIRVGQIKGWDVSMENILTGATAAELWGSGKDAFTTKNVKPISDDIFDEIIRCALSYKAYNTGDVLTQCGIIIQSQTGLRISEVLSIKSGCLHRPANGPAYFETYISKTVKGEPVLHRVFANELVVEAIEKLECSTAELRRMSGYSELFLINNHGIGVPSTLTWSNGRLRTFIRRCNIRASDGSLYHLTSHQFRATFVKKLIMKNIPISYVMKQFSHVSIEMTAHYLTLKEHEVKKIYSQAILNPESKIAGLGASHLKERTQDLFRGKTKQAIDETIAALANSMTFNPLPGGVCLYDYQRGNCSNGDGCFFYNCPNFITETSFLPILKKELELMELELNRTKNMGYERQWQIQHSRYQCLLPLVQELEGTYHESED